jgi:hypothetical protein
MKPQKRMQNRGNGSLHDEMWIRTETVYYCTERRYETSTQRSFHVWPPNLRTLVFDPSDQYMPRLYFSRSLLRRRCPRFWNFNLDSAHTSDWNIKVEIFKFNKSVRTLIVV